MPSWTSPSSSLGLLPGAGTILCCVPPACPSLEVLPLCSSPNQHASSPLDAIHFPCLLPSQRSQSQPGAASPLPNGGDTPHCVLHYTRDTFPPNPGLQNCEIKKGKSFPAGARPAGLAAVPGQPCSCPYPVHCQILQLVSCCALPIGSQIDFLYHGPVKCFSKAKILLFLWIKHRSADSARSRSWPEVWLQGKWVREAAFTDTSQSSKLSAH